MERIKKCPLDLAPPQVRKDLVTVHALWLLTTGKELHEEALGEPHLSSLTASRQVFATEVTVAKTERIGGVDRARLCELAAGRYWSEADGRSALAAFEASGLTRVAFRRETGISTQRLKWWRHRLAGTAEAADKIEFVPVEGIGTPTRRTSENVSYGDSRITGSPRPEPSAQ